MGLKYTQESAIKKMVECNNGFYDYAKTIYTGVHDKLIVTCPVHGDFQSTFSNHTHKTSPRGCPTCGVLRRVRKRTQPKEIFFEDALNEHGSLYDYSEVDYVNKDTKVKILCKEHGSFLQTPEKHIAGKGCPACAGKGVMTKARFDYKAEKHHKDTYSYELISDETFKGNPSAVVQIICKVHGVFEQNFNNHLSGQGCAKCARYGFNVGLPGILYILTSKDKTSKVGITNRDVSVRLKEINRNKTDKFDLVKTYEFDNGVDCAKVETLVLRHLRELHENVEEVFSGSTESFKDVDIAKLIEEVDKTIEEINNGKSVRACV